MRKFLGPIHFWLYDKILFQEELTAYLYDQAQKKGLLRSLENQEVTELESLIERDGAPLESLIDTMNIHAWLQKRIWKSEASYAKIITKIIFLDKKNEDFLKSAAFDFGKTHSIKGLESPTEAFKSMDDALLNGMPCDRINVTTSQDDNLFSWQLARDIHGEFWAQCGGNPDFYYELRLEVMRGLLLESPFEVNSWKILNYEITRKSA